MYSNELLRKIDIDYLTNATEYEKYLNNQVVEKVSKKDKKFYRKRICSLTKELLTTTVDDTDTLNGGSSYLNPEVKKQFDKYINCCIHNFKSIDNNDIIQDDYKMLNITNDVVENVVMQSQEEADDLLIRSVNVTTNTLDKYVIKTKLKIKKNEMILPKQKNINLRAPELKRKGVKISAKKKNIRNKYEGTNQKETPIEETCQNI